tara:strand:+ start:178 stop:1608 length:1431 start_codon:yes stop_codon:yes gene_type:complete
MVAACAEKNSSPQDYIVVLKEDLSIQSASPLIKLQATKESLAHLSKDHQVKEKQIFSQVMQGGLYQLNEEQVKQLQNDSRIAYIEKDHIVSIDAVQEDAPWNLDRIDQSSKQLDNKYRYDVAGKNVNAYVIDTGIHIAHREFEGRASYGYDFVSENEEAEDCNGHGTHVAGSIASRTYGVAKNANLIALRVLGCSGRGTTSDVIRAIEWISKNHKKPAVANLSLGGPKSKALDQAMERSIAEGITYVVAAGNSNRNACSSSPARVPSAITVGSVSRNDRRSSFSNYGPCLDVFAPGSSIRSTWHTSNSKTKIISGTSMAAPHVAGVAALILSAFPEASPQQVRDAIVDNALLGQIEDAKEQSPNALLNTEFIRIPEEISPDLKVGEQIDGLSGKQSEEYHLILRVEKDEAFEIRISGGSGDADLYVRAGKKATSSDYDCRPYRWGNEEVCKFQSAGDYHIMLRGYYDYEDLRLEVR